MRLDAQRCSRSVSILSLIPVVALAVVGGVSCGRPKAPVAHVGATWIGQPEWAAYRTDNPGGDLAGLVRQEVAFQLAEKQGLLKSVESQDFLRISQREALGRAYLATLPGHGAFTEAQAREAFMASGEARHVSHLLCPTQDKAKAALKRLNAGESFEAVASAVSTDPSAKTNGGDLGWIKRDQMVRPFADAVFTAKPGTLCGPFQTEFGWHVAKIQEVRPADAAEFERTKVSLMARMQEALENQKRPEALKPLREEYRLTADKATLDLDRTTEIAPGDEDRPAGQVAGKTISLRELKLFLSESMRMSGSSHGLGPETKEKFMDILADDYRLAAAAEKLGLGKRPEVQASVWLNQRKVAREAFAKHYLGGYKAPEADLSAHYAANKERFRGIGALKLYILVADQVDTINQAAKEAEKGTAWGRLVEKYADKVATGPWDLGWVEVSNLQKLLPGPVIQAMLQKPEGGLVGPAQGPDGLMIFRVLARRPGEVQPLQECRDAVQLDYLKERGASLVDKYLDSEGRQGIKIQEYPENAGTQKGR